MTIAMLKNSGVNKIMLKLKQHEDEKVPAGNTNEIGTLPAGFSSMNDLLLMHDFDSAVLLCFCDHVFLLFLVRWLVMLRN